MACNEGTRGSRQGSAVGRYKAVGSTRNGPRTIYIPGIIFYEKKMVYGMMSVGSQVTF